MKKGLIIVLTGGILSSCNSESGQPAEKEIHKESSINKTEGAKMNKGKTDNQIDSLAANAAATRSDEDLSKLWKATLDLPQWHFITKYKENIKDSNPFVGVIDNQPWVFVFTDRQKAQEYCVNEKNDGFTDSKGSAYIISMNTDAAIDYILELHAKGVYGMRLNEGKGWFSPIENLPAIIKHVNGKQ